LVGSLQPGFLSFMKQPSFCKNEEEYEVSKRLLYAFICSPDAKDPAKCEIGGRLDQKRCLIKRE
jgi:hypothetical protein